MTKHSTANTEKANTISLISYYHIIHSSISGKNIWKNWVTIGTWGPSIGDERKSLRERQGGTWGKGFSFSCVCETPVWTVDLLCKNEIWLMRPERALTGWGHICWSKYSWHQPPIRKLGLRKPLCVSLPVWVMLLWLFPLCYLLNFLIKKKKILKTYLTFHLCNLFQKETMSTRAKVSKEERQHCKGVDGYQWKSQREITSEGT